MRAAARPRPEDLSPACSIGECGFCPGDGVAVHAPGKRAPDEPPLFVYRCAHGCRHGGRAGVVEVRLGGP
ncbi:hypothetical protein [Streptomyces sp. DSM 118878]